MIVKLIALLLPLGLDTFAVAAALGIAGLEPQRASPWDCYAFQR